MAIAGAMLFVLAGPARAGEAPCYAGKTIRIIIPFSPGGGTDTFGRYIALHLGKHVPGNPKVAAENVTGAGGFSARTRSPSAWPRTERRCSPFPATSTCAPS
jgi:tripartite-type tricarboxylate transporter receptor subunit TctC